MKKLLFLFLTLLLGITISYAQIYVVGTDYRVGFPNKGALWKNGELYYIGDTTADVVLTDILVSDTNIYIVGYENYHAKLWINGVAQNLMDSGRWSRTSSIVVANGDTYIAGDMPNSFGRTVATLWKNGVAQHMGQDTIPTYAYSVSVEDSDVYVAGRKYIYIYYPQPKTRSIGVVWKNGEELFTIDDGSEVFFPRQWYFTDIKVVNGEIYVVGYVIQEYHSERNRALIWKNGVLQYLTEYDAEKPVANAICIVDDDVYVAGRAFFTEETWGIAVVWKNGVLLPTLYSDCVGMGEATDISVINNDIYVLTNQNNTVYVWKNDQLIYSLPHNLPYLTATAMFINPDSLPNIAIPQQPAYTQNIKLYPNPANSYITVELPREIPAAEFQLFDLQGRLLKREKINTHSTVNIHGLQQGIYLYKVTSDRQQYNGKLLITR